MQPDQMNSPFPDDERRDAPALASWQASAGMSVLGLIASQAVGSLLGAVFGPMSLGMILLVTIVYYGALIFYALAVYPSLFGKAPAMTSPGAIAFCNCMVGYMFGLIWNSCLTRGRIGVSQYVFCVGLVLMLALSFFAA